MQYKKDLSKANRIFNSYKEQIEKELNGKLIDLELESKDVYKAFDQKAGIDGILERSNELKTVALRTLFYQGFHTFTIRANRTTGTETEFRKRLRAIKNKNGALYPFLTIQTYYDKNENLVSFSIVKTEDLILLFDTLIKQGEIKFNSNKSDGNGFYYINFSDLSKYNIPHICRFVNG